MKLFYLNDTLNDQQIYLKDKFTLDYIIKPSEGRLFEFDAPEGTIPFFKIWSNNDVLISYMRIPDET